MPDSGLNGTGAIIFRYRWINDAKKGRLLGSYFSIDHRGRVELKTN